LSTILINTYRQDVPLFIGGETLYSQEGTTQGDPLAMAMYALAISQLINELKDADTKQVWYADEASTGSKLAHLRTWWESLLQKGPAYGYFPNPDKSCMDCNERRHF
jgi:hypothetical protein